MNWKQTGNTPTGSNAPSPRASLKRKKKKQQGQTPLGWHGPKAYPQQRAGSPGRRRGAWAAGV